MNAPANAPRRAAGMALIAVLWIVAALSLMVTGLVYTVRQQIGVVTAAQEQISGQALGEAAQALAMQALLTTPDRPAGAQTFPVAYAGVQMSVEIAPLNGWIALNGADAPLFTALLRTAGGLDQGRAEALAAAIVEWRDGIPQIDPTAAAAAGAMRPRKFEAPEDLLLVPGVDYPLYSRIAPLVSADLLGGAQINPQAAPPEVLAVMAQGDMGRVSQFLTQRNGGGLPDASGLTNAGAFGNRADTYRLRVRVPLEAGKILVLTSDFVLQGNRPGTTPWRVLRSSRQIAFSAG